MADEPLSWTFEVLDKLTAPFKVQADAAGGVERALEQVEAQLRKMELAQRSAAIQAEQDPWKKQVASLALQRDVLRDTAAAQAKAAAEAEKVQTSAGAFDRLKGSFDLTARAAGGPKRGLENIDKQLRRLALDEKAHAILVEKNPLRKQRMHLELHRELLSQTAEAQANAGSSALTMGGAMGFAAAFAMKAADAILAVGRAAASAAVSIVQFAIRSAAFKRDSLTAFELIEGSADKARDTYKRLDTMADKTPFKSEDVIKFGKTLRSAKFDIRETEDLLAGMFDVGAVQGAEGAEKVKGLLDAIVKIKGKDALNMETIEGVMTAGSAAGLNIESIAQSIAASRKVSFEQAKAMLLGGQIKGIEGINAVLDTIKRETDKGKALGSATLEFGQKSLDGQLSTLESRFGNLFEDLDIQPLVDVLQRINTLLSPDSPTGKRLKEFANETLGKLFETAGKLLTAENIEKAMAFVGAALEKVGAAVAYVWPLVKAFGQGMGSVLAPIARVAGTVLEKLFGIMGQGGASGGPSDKLVAVFELLGKSLGLAMVVAGAALAVFNGVLGFLFAVPLAISAFVTKIGTLGMDLVAGLWEGITKAWEGLPERFKDLVKTLPDVVKSVLQIHSPSRVMMDLGVQTVAGFERGLEDDGPQAALRDVVSPPDRALVAGGARGLFGGGIQVTVGDIIVQGAGRDAGQIADDIGSALEDRLVRAFERLDLGG